MDEDPQGSGPEPQTVTSSDEHDEIETVMELSLYELRLRRTERVRTVLQTRSAIRCSAPERLVVRIRESLLIVKEPGPRRP